MDEHSYECTPLYWHLWQNQGYEFSAKKRAQNIKRSEFQLQETTIIWSHKDSSLFFLLLFIWKVCNINA
jgi:hypothetical protein